MTLFQPSDMFVIFLWWIMLLSLGISFLPLTSSLFSSFFDKGYIFSKVIAIAVLSYTVFLLGAIRIAPFSQETIIFSLLALFLLNYYFLSYKTKPPSLKRAVLNPSLFIFLCEELLFFVALCFWSYIRIHQPDIHGLEKYMDFGFVNTILRSEYFPPKDMWFTPEIINYYYFGHLTTAVLTKLSGITPSIAYNLMLATLFAFTFTQSFSLGANLLFHALPPSLTSLLHKGKKIENKKTDWNIMGTIVTGGFVSAFLVSFAGNLHALYTLFKPYQNETPQPFWQLVYAPHLFPNSYWYPNATRFIYNTIHEFPIYSFVVADLHGHVLDIPFVLLLLAFLFSLLQKPLVTKLHIIALGFLLSCMYMTNAWDGLIYLLLSTVIMIHIKTLSPFSHESKNPIRFLLNTDGFKRYVLPTVLSCFLLFTMFFVFSLPFSSFFKPLAIVKGTGIICAPEFLIQIGRIGPFLFEENHCQRSPLWQLFVLYGFFYFWVIILGITLIWKKIAKTDVFILCLIGIATLLILVPEFVYAKDIYPAHYRANTMFKLVYQSFIMLSLVSSYVIVTLLVQYKIKLTDIKTYWKFFTFSLGFFGIIFVLIYPYFAITSYYGNLQIYQSLDGLKYLQKLYPHDYQAILWINSSIKGQPVILEAQSDSYTDYGRVSTNTGLPTVLGWTVHEWLWRGSYDIPSPRINDVKDLYESPDTKKTKALLKKYNISLVFLGHLEREKYTGIDEKKFDEYGKVIYDNGSTKIYQINERALQE